MNRSYVPGTWAKRYDRLPAARKQAVNREVDRILAERTGFTGKLDPDRDKDLVPAWLRIRDAVVSGAAKIRPRVFFRLDGVPGDSEEPRHQGWFDAVGAGSTAGPLGASPTSRTAGGGGSATPRAWGVLVWFAENQLAGPLLSPGVMRPGASVELSSPGLVITWNLTMVMVRQVRPVGPRIQVELTYGRIQFALD